jgi:hypothetical protein
MRQRLLGENANGRIKRFGLLITSVRALEELVQVQPASKFS